MTTDFIIPQSPLIKGVVTSFWEVHRYKEQCIQETIIPKGMVEVIFVFNSSPFLMRTRTVEHTVPRCFIKGYYTSPLQVLQTETHTLFGAILSPSAIKHIFKCHPVEFSNRVIDMSLVDSTIASLWQRIGEQKNFNDRVDVFTQWLYGRLPQLTDREKAFDKFLKAQGNLGIQVDSLAEQFCYSTKQLSRKLHELTGMNTERTLLFNKYLRAVHLIHTSDLSLTEIAHSCHFSDQSHFAKTFKNLCNITAREYVQRKSWLHGHILENVS